MSLQTITDSSGSLWKKVLHFPLTRMALAAVCVSLVAAVVQSLIVLIGNALGMKNSAPTAFLYYGFYLVATVVAAALVYQTYVRFIEKRPVTELARTGAWRETLVGALLGMGLMAATVGILWLLGAYQVVGVNHAMVLGAALANDGAGAFVEELLFRAIGFRILTESIGAGWALLVSTLFFGVLHLFNPQATLVSALAVGLEASLLLGAAYLLTRRIWLAVGIHAGWDFMQSGIFGAGANTAGESTKGLLQSQVGPVTWLSGGALGVEASVVALVLVLAVSIYLLVRVNQVQQRQKP